MIDAKQLRSLIRRTLQAASIYSLAAEELLMGTSAQESHLGTYIAQIKGPAKGIFQMEPATEADIWGNYLRYQPQISYEVSAISRVNGPDPFALESNLAYQILMARIHYRRVKAPLPKAGDLQGQAAYWKRYYNSELGKGTVEEYMRNYGKIMSSTSGFW